MRSFVETKLESINKERIFFYSFKPGYVFPRRDNMIVQLTNKCHMFFYRYFPDYNQWIFTYIFNCKELYIVIDELNMRRLCLASNIFKGK